MTLQSLPYVIFLGFLFGTSLIASRFGLAQIDSLVFIALRTLIAGSAYLIIYGLAGSRRKFPRDGQLWKHSAVLGVFGTVIPMVCVIGSLNYQSSGVTAILITVGPAVTVVLAHFFLADESLTPRKIAGVILALSGTLLLAIRGESGLAEINRANPLGYGMVILAVFFGSSMTIYSRKYMQRFDAFDVTSIRTFISVLIVLPYVALFVGFNFQGVDFQGYFALSYSAVAANFLGMLTAFYVIKRFGATPAAMTDYIVPVVAGLGGVLILNEQITIGMLAGVMIIVAGIALINQRQRTFGAKPV